KAIAILRNPERAKGGLNVGAALVPVRAFDGQWDLSIQLALDVDSVEFVPTAGGMGGASGSWEAGALLAREEDNKDWAMMSVSSARRAPVPQKPPAERAKAPERAQAPEQ